MDTQLKIDQKINLPLTGKYLANLEFEVELPVSVSVDYQTEVLIDQNMPLETTTDLIYQNKLLPKFPLTLDIPVCEAACTEFCVRCNFSGCAVLVVPEYSSQYASVCE